MEVDKKEAKTTEPPVEDAEAQVGITEFVTQGLSPVMFSYKYRYSDFVVHEIGTDKKLIPFVPEDIAGRR